MDGEILMPGRAEGRLVVLDEPLSFWGGYDAQTGTIIDVRHPQHGASLAGVVLAMTVGRGSSTATSVLAESIRRGTGPVAVLLAKPDVIVALGAIVAEELYGRTCPVVVLDEWAPAALPGHVTVDATGPRAHVS